MFDIAINLGIILFSLLMITGLLGRKSYEAYFTLVCLLCAVIIAFLNIIVEIFK